MLTESEIEQEKNPSESKNIEIEPAEIESEKCW